MSSRPDVKHLTPQERARLAMSMLTPQPPTRRVLDDNDNGDSNIGNADDGTKNDDAKKVDNEKVVERGNSADAGGGGGGGDDDDDDDSGAVATGSSIASGGLSGMPTVNLAYSHDATSSDEEETGRESDLRENGENKDNKGNDVGVENRDSNAKSDGAADEKDGSSASTKVESSSESDRAVAEEPVTNQSGEDMGEREGKKDDVKEDDVKVKEDDEKATKEKKSTPMFKFMAGLADKMEAKLDKAKEGVKKFAEETKRRSSASKQSNAESSPLSSTSTSTSSASAAAVGTSTARPSSDSDKKIAESVGAVFSALGLEDLAKDAEAAVKAATSEETSVNTEEKKGKVGGTKEGKEDVDGPRQRKTAKKSASKEASSATPAASNSNSNNNNKMSISAPAIPKAVTIEAICAHMNENVGLLRAEFQLSSSSLSFHKYVVHRALTKDPEVIFDYPQLAFAMLSLNVGTIHRDTWVELAGALPCIAHGTLMPDVFDAIVGSKKTGDPNTAGEKDTATSSILTMSWPVFYRFTRELLAATHPVDEEWEKICRRGNIPADERYVARFKTVTNRSASPSVAGTLIVTRDHLVHMSYVLARVTARIPLANVKDWTVLPCGSMDQNREVIVEIENGKTLEFVFPSMTDICTRGQAVRADVFAACLAELKATHKVSADLQQRKGEAEGWMNFATQHLVLARAIAEAGGSMCESLMLSSNPSGAARVEKLQTLFEKRHILSRGKAPIVFKSKRDPQSYRGVPFDLMLFAHHIDTFIDCIEPYNVAERFVIHVIYWRSPMLTAALFAAALAIAWLDFVWLIPSMILLFAAYLVHSLNDLTSIDGTVIIDDPAKKGGVGFFSGIRDTVDKMHAVHDGLQTTQNKLFKQNTRMLKLHSLFKRARPDISQMFMFALIAAAVLIVILPARWIWTAGVLYVFTWRFRSCDKNKLEKTFDGLYDSIPPVKPVNARPKRGGGGGDDDVNSDASSKKKR